MHIHRIEDLSSPGLEDYSRLTDVALRRVSEPAGGLYIAESTKVRGRALAAGHVPRSVLVQEQWLDDVAPLLEGFPDVPVFVGAAAVLERLTGYNLHRGALAAMHRPPLPAVADVLRDARRVVVLEDIVDHTIVGAIFRAVAGIGADAVLITPRCADPLYRRSVRVSMGTVQQVPGPGCPSGSRPRRCCTRPASTSRRSPWRTTPSRSTPSRRIRPSGSRSCSAPRATASAATRSAPLTRRS